MARRALDTEWKARQRRAVASPHDQKRQRERELKEYVTARLKAEVSAPKKPKMPDLFVVAA